MHWRFFLSGVTIFFYHICFFRWRVVPINYYIHIPGFVHIVTIPWSLLRHYFCEGSDTTMLNCQTLTVSTRSVPSLTRLGVEAKGTSDGGRVICLHPHTKTSPFGHRHQLGVFHNKITNKDLIVSKPSCSCVLLH